MSNSPSQEGPSFGPPPLPAGWIAQWDGVGRKYYFVQLSTGKSQWETPTEAAPTVGTPIASPAIEGQGPYAQPAQQDEKAVEGERGLGSFAMNQLLGSGKHNTNQNSSGLMGLAGSLLGGNNSSHITNQHSSSSGAGSIVGALAGSLLGGNKPSHTPQQQQQQQNQGDHNVGYNGQSGSYTGQHQYQQSGLLGKIGGFVSGHSTSEQDFGYSSSGQSQGGYTGQAPPSSYQPSGSYHPPAPPPPPPQQQQQQQSTPPHLQNQAYGGSHPQSPAPPYGASSQTQPAYGQQSQNQQQNLYNQPFYGSLPYGQAHAQENYTSPRPNHDQGQGFYAPPQSKYADAQGPHQPYGGYGAQQGSGNLQQHHHSHFQGVQNSSHEGGLYGHHGPPPPPPPPMGSHPYQSTPPGGPRPPSPSGGYGNSGGYGEPYSGERW